MPPVRKSRPGQRVRRRKTRAAAYAAVLAVVSAAVLVAANIGFQAHLTVAAASRWSACPEGQGPFHVDGTRVIGADGKVFIPYGVTLSGLAGTNYAQETAREKQAIGAIVTDWCGNAVRIQLGQDDLVSKKGTGESTAFLDVIESEVTLAESYGLVVVLNAQSESVGLEPLPTVATVAFWRILSKIYGHDPQVIFDLFNEPRLNVGACDSDASWRLLVDGGTNHGVRYVGMQSLADDVRADGARNLFWVEGPCSASTLDKATSYPVKGSGIVYDIHHPMGNAHVASTWNSDFGFLVQRKIAAVVDGEWANYTSSRGECWPDAPTAAARYLGYLHSLGIGLTGWTLDKGHLLASNNLDDPNHLNSQWRCVSTPFLNEGIGAELMHWFKRYNS